MFLSPKASSSATAENTTLMEELQKLREETEQEIGKDILIRWYGTTAISVENATVLKKDSMITINIAILVMTLFLTFFFRRLSAMPLLLLPVILGALAALSLIFLMKGAISVIAIAAGAAVLGIAINYSLHILNHSKHESSPEQLIKDLSMPLTIGCATTVGAFLSLLFLKSNALADFGLFSGLTLVFTGFFSLLILPHLIGRQSKSKHDNFIEKIVFLKFDQNKWILIGVALITLIFIFTMQSVRFESDLSAMNYMSKELAEAEKEVMKMSENSMKAIFVSSSGKTLEEALINSETVMAKASLMKNSGEINQISTPNTIIPSLKEQNRRIDRWNALFNDQTKQDVFDKIDKAAAKNGFTTEAALSFRGFAEKNYTPITPDETKILKNLVSDFISESTDGFMVINTIKLQVQHFLTVATSAGSLLKQCRAISTQYLFSVHCLCFSFMFYLMADLNLVLLPLFRCLSAGFGF